MNAATLNDHLASGGYVQVTTYLRSTLYGPKHVGMFFDKGNSLYVKRGRYSDRLSHGDSLLVGIRLLREKVSK